MLSVFYFTLFWDHLVEKKIKFLFCDGGKVYSFKVLSACLYAKQYVHMHIYIYIYLIYCLKPIVRLLKGAKPATIAFKCIIKETHNC
jgi:hypothetical protein